MLVAALGVTLVGFVLLVIALIMSSVAFAWACIVVCLIGFGLLIVDMLSVRRGSKGSVEESSAAAVAPAATAAPEVQAEDLPGDGGAALAPDVDADDAPSTEAFPPQSSDQAPLASESDYVSSVEDAPSESGTSEAGTSEASTETAEGVASVEDAVVRESEKDL